MERSFWERDRQEKVTDLAVVGGGFAACHLARCIKEQAPSFSVRILEAGSHSLGASRKNAGNLCYGSPSEILDDIDNFGKEKALETVRLRWEGMQKVRELVGPQEVELQDHGGFELFRREGEEGYVHERLDELNEDLKAIFGMAPFRPLSSSELSQMGFEEMPGACSIAHEAGVDPYLLHRALKDRVRALGVAYEQGLTVDSLEERDDKVELKVNGVRSAFKARQVVVACNGFTKRIFPEVGIKPARGQVLITHPIPSLPIRGNFHMERGDFYFRNVGSRLLFGGGRALDKEAETTDEDGSNPMIRSELDRILHEELLPGQSPRIEHRWSGIMGFTPDKRPILEDRSDRISLIGGFSGMGVALSAQMGEHIAEHVLKKGG